MRRAHPESARAGRRGDEHGGGIAIFAGTARIDETAPPAAEVAAFTEKYRDGLAGLSMTAEQFYTEYSAVVRIRPDRLRGF
ncbi:hypothetical protein [Nocardia brasiliensis]|uniref:hypothetical protein n=1 Tax=Nocardia brasiliensis TaxID=37326 RepID=UPI0015812C68|nr:hypothetical protein [Nocardia brasiliensis]